MNLTALRESFMRGELDKPAPKEPTAHQSFQIIQATLRQRGHGFMAQKSPNANEYTIIPILGCLNKITFSAQDVPKDEDEAINWMMGLVAKFESVSRG